MGYTDNGAYLFNTITAGNSTPVMITEQNFLLPRNEFLDCHEGVRAKYCGMKFTKNIGMVLLAVYLIIDGLLGFGLNLGPFIFLVYLVALAAGVLILIGK